MIFKWYRSWKYKRQHRRNIIVPSPKDDRDFKYERTGSLATTTDIDLRPGLSVVRNQGSINCCFSFAGAGIIEALMLEKTKVKYIVSPSYNYYWTRIIEGTYPQNIGCYIRNYMKSLYQYGFVFERSMPFNNTARQVPKIGAKILGVMAKDFYLTKTKYVSVLPSLYLNAIINNKPILLGLIINSSWFSVDKSGIIDDITTNQGGHAVLLVGRKTINNKKYGIIKNSWGTSWGDNGYCYVPWTHLMQKSFDAWTIDYSD